ncbi:MAG: tRNA lysidine(34) synthetase TilS [Gemmatimonadaceae bacterium]
MDELRALRMVRDGLPRRVVLAVSGGRDSMTMLDMVGRVAPERVMLVASFDHGTGPAAASAAAVVAREAAARGFPCLVGRGALGGGTEASWREARWRFLRDAARDCGGTIATGHTEDDQLETVLMRVLRGAGARGLAGLEADTGVARPLLALSRDEVAAYATVHAVPFVEDPSNGSMRHLRNRVRRDVLPALLTMRPTLRRELMALSGDAAALRREIEEVAALVPVDRVGGGGGGPGLAVARQLLATLTDEGSAALWPAVAARAGVVLDRRGTRRLVAFTRLARTGQRMQLAAGGGGIEVTSEGGDLVFRRLGRSVDRESVPLTEGSSLGPWRFLRGGSGGAAGPWGARLPLGGELTVRAWRPGDRVAASGRTFRRVKRYLREAGISAPQRIGWPVVESEGAIVWVPGVCRSDAATDRSGRPGVHVVCERIDG